MNPAVDTGPAPPSNQSSPGGAALREVGLSPVAAALRQAAAAEAAAAGTQARLYAEQVVSRSRRTASATLDSARREGRTAAREAGAARLAGARRHSRELVLAARRQAYDALRAEVISALGAQLDQPAGRRLRSWLAGLVAASTGAPAVEGSGPDGSWRVEAESGAERASVDLASVVDQALRSFAPDIERLWE